MARQRLPDDAEASNVQFFVLSSCAGRDGIACETSIPQSLDDGFAGAV